MYSLTVWPRSSALLLKLQNVLQPVDCGPSQTTWNPQDATSQAFLNEETHIHICDQISSMPVYLNKASHDIVAKTDAAVFLKDI